MTTITQNKPITSSQLKRLHILLQQTANTAYKQDLMDFHCVDGRFPRSSKELYEVEAKAIIDQLQAIKKLKENAENTKCDTMRKKVISCLRESGYNIAGRADMQRIYAWVLKYGHAGKELNKYDYNELVKLVTQAERVKASHLKSIGNGK